MNASPLRAQVELALKDRFPSPFTFREPAAPETISTGIAELDRLTAGLPRGGLAEICGQQSSGRTALLMSILADATGNGELCALLDGQDTLDPHSAVAAGVDLSRLLWVRCRRVEQAIRAAELLLEGGGFGVVALDLAGTPAPLMRRIPLSVWFRLKWCVRKTRTALIVLEQEPTVGSSAALVVRLQAESSCWSGGPRIFRKATLPGISKRYELPSHILLLSGLLLSAATLRSRHRFEARARAPLKAQAVWR